ncbi:hypothetical protein C8R46DRAFT_90977 [Mycena filopes]|nr:hypothetical protein C8R46DRAFT_90977 [Mycena filopes]
MMLYTLDDEAAMMARAPSPLANTYCEPAIIALPPIGQDLSTTMRLLTRFSGSSPDEDDNFWIECSSSPAAQNLRQPYGYLQIPPRLPTRWAQRSISTLGLRAETYRTVSAVLRGLIKMRGDGAQRHQRINALVNSVITPVRSKSALPRITTRKLTPTQPVAPNDVRGHADGFLFAAAMEDGDTGGQLHGRARRSGVLGSVVSEAAGAAMDGRGLRSR